jgi:hypothetical protein
MKKLLKISCLFLFVFFIVHGNGKAQNEFKGKIAPILDSINEPYVLLKENMYKLSYCEDNICNMVYISLQNIGEDPNGRYISCASIIFEDTENAEPTKSIIQKIYELNQDGNIGFIKVQKQENEYQIIYQNSIWFDDANVKSLFKNIYLSYIYANQYKKEFAIFKE